MPFTYVIFSFQCSSWKCTLHSKEFVPDASALLQQRRERSPQNSIGKGSSNNDVTVLGRGDKWFCDKSTKALEIKSVTLGEGNQKLSKFAWRHLWKTPKLEQSFKYKWQKNCKSPNFHKNRVNSVRYSFSLSGLLTPDLNTTMLSPSLNFECFCQIWRYNDNYTFTES